MATTKVITIERHIIEQERAIGNATGDFSGLLRDLTLAIKIIRREVTRAGLVDVLGATGYSNIQGEEVMKLDEFANDTIFRAMDHGGHLCAMASEESDTIMNIPDQYPKGKYALAFDPLDGSTNIDANVTIGTIFSIHKRVTPAGTPGTEKDFLQAGYKQVGAGYATYGPSVMLTYSAGRGVHSFTFDPSVGEFLLSHENITMPRHTPMYSVNEGNYGKWADDGMRRYIDWAKSDDEKKKAYGLRYVGSMVSDLHRTLLKGGVFIYPADSKNKNGKLRLLYEASPMAFLIEQAGGRATTGRERILDIEPTGLHQRTPLIIGSEDNVKEVEEFLK